MNVPFVTDNLRRGDLENFLKVLHLADNSTMPQDGSADKYYKVRPLFDIANQNFSKMPIPTTMSVDEHMVRYFGRHSTKKFVRGKPIRYGFEIFGIASPGGFLHHAEPSCGKSTKFMILTSVTVLTLSSP